ncbi:MULTISPECIES: TonB-dependent receptor [unclassified Sphingomonas]|uniref:TonB-dependent receptor n=3 Tax=Bacteria TaxID=2 RepID=UPI000E104A84|nr:MULTISPECIES: TonB-dependent receptor [unclassified Sphingomonas]AXJ95019.1 TonB-dependent receptor [Sphingomonas sp. FARSPH]
MRMGLAMTMAAVSWPAMAAAQQAQTSAPAQKAPAKAAAPAAQADENSDEPDIIVRGTRNLPGSVIGDIPPEQQLDPADIRAYGVSSVSDLLTELSPQTTSGVGGPPVVLLDGKRIAGFQEIRDIPTEAIARVDILPEEVALKYGYTADQKVVNIVLRRRFRATSVELSDKAATAGGNNTPQVQLGILSIRNGGRLNINTNYQQSSALTESERNIAAAATEGATTGFDQRPYRTLLPFTRTVSTNAVYARPIGGVSATINGEVATSDSIGQYGLPTATFAVPAGNPFAPNGATTVTNVLSGGDFLPLAQRSQGITAHLGTSLNGRLSSKWLWTVTGTYDRADTHTFTETGVDTSAYQARINANDPTANPSARLTPADVAAGIANRGRSLSNSGQIQALVNGPIVDLPAGPISTSLRVGAQSSSLDSSAFRIGQNGVGITSAGQVSRDIVNGRVNIDVPIASRVKNVLGAIGSLSLNANAAVDHLSDFGTLYTYGYGFNWSPLNGVRVIGSVSQQDEAPSAAQLGNPQIVTPNVRVFDYIKGATATVTTISGGNAALTEDNRRVLRFGLNLKPWDDKDLTLIAGYTDTRVNNPIASFPTPTAAIEAAYPVRFTRDADGNLLRLDTRPINYARTEDSSLRWGINFSKPIKSRIQKEIEAFRAGTGPNPFAGLRIPGFPGGGGGRREGGSERADAGAPPPPSAGDAPPPPPAGDAPPPPGEGGGRGPGGFGGGRGGYGGGFGGGGRGGGQGGGRIQFAFYHTWHLTDRVLVTPGGPALDLLNGDAIGQTGGQPRHEFEVQTGYSNNGIGVRLSGDYQTGTRVNGGTAAQPQSLTFSGLATANLRIFADLQQQLPLLKAHPWVRGLRLTLGVDNILDSRQRVRDANGITPISYQPDYLNPLGRTIRLSIRKLFSPPPQFRPPSQAS